MKKLNPKDFNLTSRTEILEIAENKIAIVKKRKSRIIMKDGEAILKQIQNIKAINPNYKLVLIISGPICSKTLKLMAENGVEVIVE